MTDQENEAYIKNPENWHLRIGEAEIRTMELWYKKANAYRTDVFKDGKWRKKCWYRFHPETMKPVVMDLRSFVRYLKEHENYEKR